MNRVNLLVKSKATITVPTNHRAISEKFIAQLRRCQIRNSDPRAESRFGDCGGRREGESYGRICPCFSDGRAVRAPALAFRPIRLDFAIFDAFRSVDNSCEEFSFKGCRDCIHTLSHFWASSARYYSFGITLSPGRYDDRFPRFRSHAGPLSTPCTCCQST